VRGDPAARRRVCADVARVDVAGRAGRVDPVDRVRHEQLDIARAAVGEQLPGRRLERGDDVAGRRFGVDALGAQADYRNNYARELGL